MATSINTVKGGIRLAFDSVEVITNTVEQMHETIARRPLPCDPTPPGSTRSHGLIASSVYRVLRGTTHLLREGTDRVFDLAPAGDNAADNSGREIRAMAALNGAFGDHLEATGNALAIPMNLWTPDRPLDLDAPALATALPDATPHIVVFAHGLSLSELSWNRNGGPDTGSRLQHELGYSSLYLRYNTGRHISTNGQELSRLLDDLCTAWPVPVESLSLVGHSMGGLVIRSSCRYAQQEQHAWLQKLQRVVCLGTPHHGSPVEKAGHAFDIAIRKIPYLAPFAVGRGRSAGIKDLRHGNLLDEDWQGRDLDQPAPDGRSTVPLLDGVEYFFAAATLGKHKNDPLGHILGDLLVRLDSAAGHHHDDLRKLHINPENCQVFYGRNHFDLLDDERVQQKILEWFQ